MTTTVVGLFIENGVVTLYLEQLSCEGKFFKIHTMPAIFYKKLRYKFVGVMKNIVDGKMHQNI
jgi:ketol-acid reductoisomerase